MTLVVAHTSFHGPGGLALVEGQLFDAAHPIVVAHPGSSDPPTRSPSGRPDEMATDPSGPTSTGVVRLPLRPMTDSDVTGMIGTPVFPEHRPQPHYANVVQIMPTPWDIKITFALFDTPMSDDIPKDQVPVFRPTVVTEVILPLRTARELVPLLNQMIANHDSQYGSPGGPPQ